MSFGRSLMNAATLGAWGWLTDPDIEEFYFESGGTISYHGSGEGIPIAKDFFKKYNVIADKKHSHVGYFKNTKDADKAMHALVDNYRELYKRRDLMLQIDAPEYASMVRRDGQNYLNFFREENTTHCKECGRVVAYGRRLKATNVRCPEHKKAGKFLVKPKKAASHKWYHVRAAFYDLDAYEIGERWDLESDDEEDDD